MGTKSSESNAKTPLAHAVPSLLYICTVNSGNIAPNVYLKAPLAAITALGLLAKGQVQKKGAHQMRRCL
jgi:hypothetical protein